MNEFYKEKLYKLIYDCMINLMKKSITLKLT